MHIFIHTQKIPPKNKGDKPTEVESAEPESDSEDAEILKRTRKEAKGRSKEKKLLSA